MDLILGPINKALDGKKTLLGGIGGILTVLGYFLTTGLADGLQIADIVKLGAGLSAGLAVLGFGGKLQKLIDAVKK